MCFIQEEEEDSTMLAFLAAVAMTDIFTTGELKIEPAGPDNFRLIFHVQKRIMDRDIAVPVTAVVVPATSMMLNASKLAAAHLLSRADNVGVPQGSG